MFNRSSVSRQVAAAVALVAFSLPNCLEAQARAQITPFFAAFFAPLPYGKDIDQGGGATADERLANAPGVGIRASFPLSSQIGIEGQVSYVFAGRQATFGGSGSVVGVFVEGNALMASGRVTLHPRRSNFRGILGVGYQKLGGDGWDEDNFTGADFNVSTIGGILGAGVRANITSRFAVDLTVESFLHSSDPANFGEKRFQADISLTVGVPISLGRR